MVSGEMIQLVVIREARTDEDRDPVVDSVPQTARSACELTVPVMELAMAVRARQHTT
jgi:hypothetical protein